MMNSKTKAYFADYLMIADASINANKSIIEVIKETSKGMEKLKALKYALARVGEEVGPEDVNSLVNNMKDALSNMRGLIETYYNMEMEELKGVDDYGQLMLFPTGEKLLKEFLKEG